MVRILVALRKFNTIALSIVLILAMVLAALALLEWLRTPRSTGHYDWQPPVSGKGNEIGGQRIEAGDRFLTLYSRKWDNDEFKTDLRFIDDRTGMTTKLGRDAKQEMYGGSVMGVRNRKTIDNGYGYFVRAKTDEQSARPLFDVLFLRFSDMQAFTLASGVSAADASELDGKSFSAVVWDAKDRASFVLFDVEQGKLVLTRDLEMDGMQRSDPDAAATAPINRFD